MGRRMDAWTKRFMKQAEREKNAPRWFRRLFICTLPFSLVAHVIFVIGPEATRGMWAEFADEIEDNWKRK